ncbi:MAG TPA: ATPase domain-containing protein [archaeon]|nr:ATPase domain-containing protein [archaeon]
MVSQDRVATYIPGLDDLIEGGFPKSSLILISGTPGTGKSNFCSHVLYNNAVKGKKCLYLNLEQGEGRLEMQMKQFGWDASKAQNLKIVTIDSSNPQIVENVLREIEKGPYDIVALDSLDSISTNPASVEEIQQQLRDRIPTITLPALFDQATLSRLKIKKIFSAITKSKATAIVTSERVEGAQGISRDTVSEFLCDGTLLLSSAAIGKKRVRTLEISKMRYTDTPGGRYDLEITKKGLIVSGL